MASIKLLTATIALLLTGVLGAPRQLHAVQKFSGPKVPGSYIVKFKEGASRTPLVKQIGANVTFYDKQLINGFAGQLSAEGLDAVRSHPDVEYIEEDGIMHAFSTVTQTDATWGLQRISQDGPLPAGSNPSALTYTYKYDSSAGGGVNVYVVDTGIYTAHSQFGGRAAWGATFGGYANADGSGHGTHVAGTIGAAQFGVAKAANLIAVKVLSDQGSGTISDIISGLNYVLAQSQATGRPTVASLSLGGSVSTALDNAVTAIINGGVHVVVAAGGSNTDAGNTSPARVAAAITVGATTIADARASSSSYGSVIDIFAPGQIVVSTWIGSTTAVNTLSGTSMATAHVSGLVAYLLALPTTVTKTPAAIQALVKELAVKNVLSGIPAGTLNYLASNNI